MITPYGLFVVNYWFVNNKFKMYNPIRQNYGHIKAIESITKPIKELSFISMISFTMRCRFSIEPELRGISSDELIIYDVELTEFIHRKIVRLKIENPEPLLKVDEIDSIHETIAQKNIIDPQIRNQHIERQKIKVK